jgi:chemotaxis protein histidine kinase CheA
VFRNEKESVMAVDAVSSSVSLAANAAASAQLRARTPAEEQQSAQKVDNSRVQAQRGAAASARVEAERIQPTVNTSGQTVGTRVNTTA